MHYLAIVHIETLQDMVFIFDFSQIQHRRIVFLHGFEGRTGMPQSC